MKRPRDMTEEERKAHLKELDRIRKERFFAKKQDNAPWVDCGCGCGEKLKSIDAYGRPKAFINGHNTRKYDDPAEHKRVYARKRYKDPALKERIREQQTRYHHQRKAKLILLKGGKCNNCGLEYDGSNGAVFQFHHRDPSEKTDRIHYYWSWVRIIAEAEKTDLVCANCHFLIHGGSY